MRTQHSATEVGILLAGGGCISDSSGRGSSVPSPGSESDCSPALGLGGGVKAVRGVMSHYWSLESLHSTNGKTPSPLNLDTELHFELDVHVRGRCHGMVTFSFCKVGMVTDKPMTVSQALVITDGAQDKSGLADEVGSEDDLYNEFRSSSNRFGHPGGGGGEQLAINEYRILSPPSPHLRLCPAAAAKASLRYSGILDTLRSTAS
ncbi:Rho guanine nucleotide exchange factor 4 APC-stimulated guanine nucleotide exchange factor 1 [Triplophysa tibetana]|uniref:Rho guanine nucleotide exchange factor 4 APC-stimulated guanine nucleotide exchange factor 1 n=1 Tax=Triplophysa tibetana TaxID=1572043 RepID=A0A5A9PDJ8_9TELE|nr:Rho guanine nucleotide exchange factor 4 APC-stimulated guanine nucleotide exchange factor 1 [Triplophysa tibetana]